MSAHTPGPWRAASREGEDFDSVVYIPGTPNEVCQCFHERGNEDECEANAHLIAAAPQMYEALSSGDRTLPDLLDWVADRIVHVYGERVGVDFVTALRSKAKAARAAIAAAEGCAA